MKPTTSQILNHCGIYITIGKGKAQMPLFDYLVRVATNTGLYYIPVEASDELEAKEVADYVINSVFDNHDITRLLFSDRHFNIINH